MEEWGRRCYHNPEGALEGEAEGARGQVVEVAYGFPAVFFYPV